MMIPISVAREDKLVDSLRVPAPAVVVVGRHADCHIRLNDELVSRNHVRLLLGAATFIVEDASSNGTIVAKDDILKHARRELSYGSEIYVGPFALTVGCPEESNGHRPPPRAHVERTPDFGVQLERPREPAPRPGPSAPQLPTPSAIGVGARPPVPKPSAPPIEEVRLPESLDADASSADAESDLVQLRREIHEALLKNLDLARIEASRLDDPSLRPRVLTALKRIVGERGSSLPPSVSRDALIGELLDEALGLGPLEPLLADHSVTEIMVIDPRTIYVERNGRLELTPTVFTDEERVRSVIERIVTPLGRRIDESQPLVDARLRDGSRVNAIIRPLALRGSCITIRKFPKRRLGLDDLIRMGSINEQVARFLVRCVAAKKNILISGGTGSGKTTLLNVLSGAIPAEERIVTIEDAAELQLHQPHVVPLETKTANMEGKGAFTIRDLVKNSLRMRPDRIIVGECRGGEALDMLQAMNTGHDGSLTTIHSNSPEEAVVRLETLSLMAGLDLPSRAIREHIARSIHVIVQQSRLQDGSRKITDVSEVIEGDQPGELEVRKIFEFERDSIDEDGRVVGDFRATGYLPSFLDEFFIRGLIRKGDRWL